MAKRKVRTSRLHEGMIIKRDVYSLSGLVLVPENTQVTKDVIELLTKHFIEDVIIESNIVLSEHGAVRVKENFSTTPEQQLKQFQESFQVAEENLSQSLLNILNCDDDIDTPLLLDSLNTVIQTADNDVHLCDMMSHMKKKVQNLYTHSINVAIFSQILAKWLNCTKEEIELASIAGLLHDIGILKCLPSNTASISFQNELSGASYDKHVVHSYQLVKDKNIDSRIKQAILTHHERIDNSGFPLKISAANINRISRILAVADTYDILTMSESGQPAMSQFETIKYLEEQAYGKLDSHILMTFLDKIAHTLIQHQVLLSNGQIGRVVMINKYNLSRPLIQTGSAFVDLSVKSGLTITEVLD